MAYPNPYARGAQQPYNNLPQPGNPRNTEGWALIQAARRLAEAAAAENPRTAMRDALRLNWRLWTIFQVEMSAEDCPAPTEVRENILSLCQFIDRHTVELMADPVEDRLKVLIDINRNIAAGLMTPVETPLETQDAATEAAPQFVGEQV